LHSLLSLNCSTYNHCFILYRNIEHNTLKLYVCTNVQLYNAVSMSHHSGGKTEMKLVCGSHFPTAPHPAVMKLWKTGSLKQSYGSSVIETPGNLCMCKPSTLCVFKRIFEFSLQAFQYFQKKAFCVATKLPLQCNLKHLSERQCHTSDTYYAYVSKAVLCPSTNDIDSEQGYIEKSRQID